CVAWSGQRAGPAACRRRTLGAGRRCTNKGRDDPEGENPESPDQPRPEPGRQRHTEGRRLTYPPAPHTPPHPPRPDRGPQRQTEGRRLPSPPAPLTAATGSSSASGHVRLPLTLVI